MRLVLSAEGMPYGALQLAMPSAAGEAAPSAACDEPPDMMVAELLMESFPAVRCEPGGSRGNTDAAGAAPHLVAVLSDGTLLMYRAFLPPQV